MKSGWDVVADRKSCSGKLGGSATFADLLERESCRLCFRALLLVTSREITPIVATPAMGTEAGLAPLRPDECLDLDLWDHIFDDAAVAKRSPLRTLARDMRAQLEVTPVIPPHVATRIRRHLPRLNHPD